jgi:hypothetical protein
MKALEGALTDAVAVVQSSSDAAKAKRAALLAGEAAVRGRALDALRGAMAPRPALLEEARRIEAEAERGAGDLGEQVDAALAEGTASLSASLEEELREWRTAAADQGRRVSALKSEARYGTSPLQHPPTAAVYSLYPSPTPASTPRLKTSITISSSCDAS